MGATFTKRGESYRVAIHANGERRYVTVRSKADAEGLVREIRRQELAGVNVLEGIKRARTNTPTQSTTFPTLREALDEWIDGQVRVAISGSPRRKATARGCACGRIPRLATRPWIRSRVSSWAPVSGPSEKRASHLASCVGFATRSGSSMRD